jgi:hypothetical protein
MAFGAGIVKIQLLSAVYLFFGSAVENLLQAFWRCAKAHLHSLGKPGTPSPEHAQWLL